MHFTRCDLDHTRSSNIREKTEVTSNIAVVTTSINAEPPVYADWARAADLFVAGDRNSPATLVAYVRDLGGVYLTPYAQEAFMFSDSIGWNNIQRRNAAIMEAYARGYDYILTVDDDNYPQNGAEAFIADHMKNLDQAPGLVTVGAMTNFLNTGALCMPQFHQRGVPYGVNTTPVIRVVDVAPRIVVSQAQVLGDPDCDAVERMCHAPDVVAVMQNAVVKPGTYAAFNSQATMWSRDWAPVMAVLPGIGRYDDIFASYIFARLARTYNTTVFVGEPCMKQIRNEHNLVNDLKAEYWGMSNVFTFCRALDNAHIDASMPLWHAYSELISAVSFVIPTRTVEFANEWVRTWRENVTSR